MALMKRRARRARAAGDDVTAANIALDGGGNLWAAEAEGRTGADFRARRIGAVLAVLAALYALALVVPHGMTSLSAIMAGHLDIVPLYTPADLAQDLSVNMSHVAAALTGSVSPELAEKAMRYAVAALAGAGLALSGAVYQGAFRNALVSPSTLGVMTGGSLGVMVWVVLFVDGGVLTAIGLRDSVNDGYGYNADGIQLALLQFFGSQWSGLPWFSLVGCLLVVCAVLLVRRAGGPRQSAIWLIITGQVVASVIGVARTLVTYYYSVAAPDSEISQYLRELQVASFYRPYEVLDVAILAAAVGLTLAAVLALRQRMMMLSLDTAEQRSMGLDPKRLQLAVVGVTTLLTALVISFCGAVGFVGFLVPHLARRLVGPNFKYLLPASAAVGAVFVMGAYLVIEATIGSSYVQLTGMVISIAGAAVFLATAIRGEGVRLGSFK